MSGARSLKSDEVLGVQGVSKLTKLPTTEAQLLYCPGWSEFVAKETTH